MSLVQIGGLVAIGVPALIAATVARRWLAPAMLLWLVSPAIVFLGLTVLGSLIGPPPQPQTGNVLYGFLLIGSFLLVPWILSCLVGFAIGLVIRRRHPRSAPTVPAAKPQIRVASVSVLEREDASGSGNVPTERPAVPHGASRDGTLRYEHRLGDLVHGRYDAVSPWAVLIDAATDRVLVDCSGWMFSRIDAQTDGSLFLHLRQNGFETLFRIEPATRLFRDQGIGGPERPLGELATVAEEARQAAMQQHSTPPHYRWISPDGTIRVDLASEEWSNAQWVNAPRVIEIADGRVLLDLWGTDWDATVSFPREGAVRLGCRRYHLGGSLSVTLDVPRGSYRILLDPGTGETFPEAQLAELAPGLEAASQRAAALAGGTGWGQEGDAPPHALAAWRTALVIFAGAAVAIAGAAYISTRFVPAPVQKLTPMPKMPDFAPR